MSNPDQTLSETTTSTSTVCATTTQTILATVSHVIDALLPTTLANLQDTTSHSHPLDESIFGGTMQHEVEGELRNLSVGYFCYGK